MKQIYQRISKILDIIRLERIKKGYSQEYVSEQLQLSQYAYHKIENGKTKLQLECLLKLCSILEIDIQMLFSD